MIIHRTHLTLAMTALATSILMSAPPAFAETLLVDGVRENNVDRWKWNDQRSNGKQIPLIIEVVQDDVLHFKSVNGRHGVETIDEKGNEGPSEDDDFVAKCGEQKPSAVLEEIGPCRNGSNYGKKIDAIADLMILRVRDNFSGEVHFRCSQHLNNMWGTIRLKN